MIDSIFIFNSTVPLMDNMKMFVSEETVYLHISEMFLCSSYILLTDHWYCDLQRITWGKIHIEVYNS